MLLIYRCSDNHGSEKVSNWSFPKKNILIQLSAFLFPKLFRVIDSVLFLVILSQVVYILLYRMCKEIAKGKTVYTVQSEAIEQGLGTGEFRMESID